MRDLKISAVLNGYIVKAGCQTLVFQSARELLRELEAYLNNPAEVEKRFVATAPYGMQPGPDAGPVPMTPDRAYVDARVQDPYNNVNGAYVGSASQTQAIGSR